MKKILLLQCFLLFSGTMAFSQKELSESPFKNVIGQTINDLDKHLYWIQTSEYSITFHYYKKNQTYTIIDIIPFHEFVENKVPKQIKDSVNSFLPPNYLICVLKNKVTGLTNNFISPQKISIANDTLTFITDSVQSQLFFKFYLNRFKHIYTDCGINYSGDIFLSTRTGFKIPIQTKILNKLEIVFDKQLQAQHQAKIEDQQTEATKKLVEFEKQRKRQALIKKYGTHYAQCIEDKKIELGMPKEIFFEIKDKDFISRIQESLVHGVRVEIYQEIRAGSALIYGYNKYHYYRFENGKLVSYLYD